MLYTNLFYAVFFFIIFLLFIYQTTKKGRSAPNFVISLFFDVLGGVFSFLDYIFPTNGAGVDLFGILLDLFFGMQFMFFFLFMENLRSLKIDALRLTFAVIIFTIQICSSLGMILFSHLVGYNSIVSILNFSSNISNDVLALYVYLVIGVPIYVKMHRYAKEIRSFILSLALIMVGIGFFLMAISDIIDFFGLSSGWLSVIISDLPID